MAKLHYELNGTVVKVTEFRGEKFSDEKKEVLNVVEFDAAEVPSLLKNGDAEISLAAYGLSKLLQDRTSQEKGSADKLTLMGEYFNEYFINGLWKRPAAERAPVATGSRRKITASLAEAIARLQGITAIAAESSLKALDKERFDAVCKNPRVVDMIKEIEAENATDSVDLSDLLG